MSLHTFLIVNGVHHSWDPDRHEIYLLGATFSATLQPFVFLYWQHILPAPVMYGFDKGGHPVLRFGNVVIDTDATGNIKVTKAKSKEKVDGIAAAIMAIDRCVRNQVELHASVYDELGLLVLKKSLDKLSIDVYTIN